jgi:hypothetical protein
MRKLFKIFAGLFFTVAGIYALNAGIIYFAQPANIQQGESNIKVAAEYGNVSIVFLEDLKAGGLGNLATGAKGYVNVMSPDSVIYLNKSTYTKAPTQTTYIYKHEFAHILQKQLVAKTVGGYPSYENPWISFSYYFHLLKLNNDLANLMPQDNHDAVVSSPFSGLEVSADCFAQQREYVGKPMQYLGSVGCNAEQRYIAIGLIVERWPEPLTDEQKQEVKDRETKLTKAKGKVN